MLRIFEKLNLKIHQRAYKQIGDQSRNTLAWNHLDLQKHPHIWESLSLKICKRLIIDWKWSKKYLSLTSISSNIEATDALELWLILSEGYLVDNMSFYLRKSMSQVG